MRIGWKLVLVGLMLLLLLIPLGLLDSLVAERQARGQEVADEIARSSSGPQQVVGPLLLVEAHKLTERRRVVTEGGVMREETEQASETVHYLVSPTKLAVDSRLRIERRGRSLFTVPLFHGALKLAGEFRHEVHALEDGSRLKPVRAWLVVGLALLLVEGILRFVFFRKFP